MRGTLAVRLVAISLLQLLLLVAVFQLGGVVASGVAHGARRGAEVTVYDGQGSLVVSTVDPPLRANAPHVDAETALVGGHPGTILARGPGHAHGPPYLTAVNTIFVGGLVILVIGSFLTARGIVRPLRQLARVARVIGEGDLRARTGVYRADEIGDVARAFDDMAVRVEQLLLAEKELLANISHELRTPLARIRVALDIAGEATAEVGTATLAEIGTDLSEIEALIDDVFTATRLDIEGGSPRASRLELHTEERSPRDVCHNAEGRFRTRHPARPLAMDVADELPGVEVDPVLFRRVLDNLLENAHKYSPNPKASITLRAAPGVSGSVVFAVEDHGMGIAEEDIPRIFAPFFRADRSRTRHTGGVGLGLALAKRIVEAHGGAIEVSSALHGGTTVRVEIPVVPSSVTIRSHRDIGPKDAGRMILSRKDAAMPHPSAPSTSVFIAAPRTPRSPNPTGAVS